MVKTNDTTNHKAKIFLGVIFLKIFLSVGFCKFKFHRKNVNKR
jgi:hypothetical protein